MKYGFNLLFLVLILIPFAIKAQDLKTDRDVHQSILKVIKNDIEENYYDPTYHGIDIEENYKKTSELIRNAGSSQVMTDLIARFCLQFDDSHLYFEPPGKTFTVNYGINLQMVDDKAFVVEIDDTSNAYQKGVRIGDQVYMIEGFILNRQEFSVLMRHYFDLQPQPALKILIIKPDGSKFKLEIEAKIEAAGKFMPSKRDIEIAEQNYESEIAPELIKNYVQGLAILRMKSFDLSTIKINKMMDKVEKSDALILDLRGNRGGYSDSLEQLIANFFDRDVDVGTKFTRKGKKRILVKQKVKRPYKGKLLVLIDSDSASAAEVFTRVVQLEKRGVVIGDRSAGAVMESIYIPHSFGLKSYVFYGLSVTIADLVMKDGARLEKTGVIPDEKIVPTALDLAKSRDPVLARGIKLLGSEISSEDAGKLFTLKKSE
jgi:carboxyl-terminal processing protease